MEGKIKSLQHELTTGERNIDSYISAITHCVVAFDFCWSNVLSRSSWYSLN